jgi:hypothetical protein
VLGLGERGVLPIMAASTLQAGQAYNFLKGIFTDIPRFAAVVDGITGDTIALKNRVDIQIRPASFRTIRGITAIGAIAEECSMWQSDDSRNPDKEILAAVRPSMATTGGTLFAIGSPHARKGEMWGTYRKHYGAGGNPAILVANGPTKLFNPTIKQFVIDRAYEDDPQVAAAEWGGVFRDDLESYVSPETVDACTERGVVQRPFKSGIYYVAHADPSGGRQDSFAIAVGHIENGVGVVDVLLERRPPFSPESTVAEFCDVLKGYGIARVEGDRYGAEFTQELFRKNGIEYVEAECTTSDFFAGFLPILNSGRVSLLDHRRLASQLCALERRTSRVGAKDQIGHPPNGHDDCACVVAGLIVNLVGARNAPSLIRQSDILVNGAALPLPANSRAVFAALAVGKDGMAAVIFAAKTWTGPALLILDFDIAPLSGTLLTDIGARVREFAIQCRARGYVMMVPESMLMHAQAIGLPAEAIPGHVKAEDLLLSAASFAAAGDVKLCEPAFAKTKTSPFGGALDFRADADVDDPLRASTILATCLGLDETLSTTKAA